MDYHRHVEYLLKNHNALETETKELLKLLTLPPKAPLKSYITPEDAIEILALKRSENQRFKEGYYSNKTQEAALNYEDALNYKENLPLLNPKERQKLKAIVANRSKELSTLNSAINSLKDLEQKAIKSLYFEGKNYRQVSRSLSISESTLSRYRKKALDSMANFFEIIHSS